MLRKTYKTQTYLYPLININLIIFRINQSYGLLINIS